MAQQMKKWDEARAILETCVGRHPEAWLAWYQIGRIAAVTSEQLEHGADALRNFIQNAPQDSPMPRDAAYQRLGQVYEQQGKKAEAREQFAAALKANPANEEAKAGMARLGAN